MVAGGMYGLASQTAPTPTKLCSYPQLPQHYSVNLYCKLAMYLFSAMVKLWVKFKSRKHQAILPWTPRLAARSGGNGLIGEVWGR